jgi:glycosyltransferase involved in cell wall biosynthesis
MATSENSPIRTVRIFSPHFPYPPRGGAEQVIFDQALSLVELGFTVEMVVWKQSAEQVEKMKSERYPIPFPPQIQVRHLGPRREPSSAFRVARMLFSELSSNEIHYYPRFDLSGLPESDLDLFHYSFAYAWLRDRSRLPPARKRVVIFHNIESELALQRAHDSQAPRSWIHRSNSNKLQSHEKKLPDLVDECWFLSPADLAELNPPNKRITPPTLSPLLRNYRKERFERAKPSRQILGFVGALDFHPNIESAQWILKELCPILHQKGFAGELWIVGRNPPQSLAKDAELYPWVKLLGYLEDLEDFWAKVSLTLVPHIQGSGVRIKLLESVASGVPVLATHAAMSRMSSEQQALPLLQVSDDPGQWVQWIMSAASSDSQDRQKAYQTPFPEALDGRRIFCFLKQSD